MRINKISFLGFGQNQKSSVKKKGTPNNLSANAELKSNTSRYDEADTVLPDIIQADIRHKEKFKNLYVEDYDPVTGNLLRGTSYLDDGKTVECIEDYDPVTLNKIKETGYFDDGKTVSYTYDYDPENEDLLKATYYYDGKAIEILAEYESKNGVSHIIKETHYRCDGKTVNYIIDFDPSTANVLRTTYYKADGITVDRVEKTL